MAQTEDCASVLEQFVQDVANLPAEICHLMEEIQAKDKLIQECRTAIVQRDNSLQKFIKQNGSLEKHPKEELYNGQILAFMEKQEGLQDEKIALSEKASKLIDRHAKRLENEMKKLVSDGALPADSISSIRNVSSRSTNAFFDNYEAFTTNGRETPPLQPSASAGNVMPSLNAIRRLADNVGSIGIRPTPNIAAAMLAGAQPRSSAPASPAATHHIARGQRESSASAVEKRKGLTQRLNMPTTSSNLRQSSLGPGTSKAGTPTGTRAGSAQPRAGVTKKVTNKLAPHQQIRQKFKGHKVPKRRHKGAHKASPSSMGDDEESVVSEMDSGSENASQVAGRHGSQEDEEMDDADDGGDDRKYCVCNSVSYGNMVACDNDDCPREWFHWSCVGLTKEPVGTWYCPDCSKKIIKT